MPGSVLQGDFTAGELSPSLSARVDLAKYVKGCRTLTNFLVQAHGGAVKRPGFVLLDELPGEAVLVPFVFSQTQAYCLAFGERWLRVATPDGFVLDSGGQIYQIASPYTLEQAKNISHTQSADVLFIVVHGVVPTRLCRYGHADWRFVPMTFTEPLPSPANQRATRSGGTETTPYTYYVTAVDGDGRESGRPVGVRINGSPSNNWTAGSYIEVAWDAVPGAVEYRIYKSSFGGRPGFVAYSTDLSWRDMNVSPSVTEGAPVYDDPFPGGDYPGAVCIYEQRLVFASSPNRPQTIWMSKSGDYGNFATYKPQSADAPIELTIASQEVSPMNWMIPLRSLIAGMGGAEWEISGRGDAAFSATNAKAAPQSYWGSSLKNAIVIGNVILHVSSSGRHVRSLQYEFAADSYGGKDLSIMAAHLLENARIVDWTYQKSPDSVVWAVREDGVLLGLTFQAEHQIVAWHKHTTQGKFRAVCAIPNGMEDCLFAVVERDGVLYLERTAKRYLGGDPKEAVFLDCALTWRGEQPARGVSGLHHLEGKEVGIFADGAVQAPRVVRDGKVTLDIAASVVTVGLVYVADLETMPIEVIAQAGTSVAQKKQVNAVNILFRDSLGVKAGLSSFDSKMQPVKWRTVEPYGKPPAPYSGWKSIVMPSLADNIVTACVRSDMPTPVTVLALSSRVEVNQ